MVGPEFKCRSVGPRAPNSWPLCCLALGWVSYSGSRPLQEVKVSRDSRVAPICTGSFCLSEVKVSQSCLILCNPMDYTVYGILQARMLEWVTFPFFRRSSQPRDQTQVSCIAGGFFTSWTTREAGDNIKLDILPEDNIKTKSFILKGIYFSHHIFSKEVIKKSCFILLVYF